MARFWKCIRTWIDPDYQDFLKRKRHVCWRGRWMTVEAFLDERQFAVVLEVDDPAP